MVLYPLMFFFCFNSFNFDYKDEYFAWIFSYEHVDASNISLKKLNFGPIFFSVYLKFGKPKFKETRLGNLRLLLLLPVTIYLVDYKEGLVFNDDIDLMEVVSS